MGKYHVHRTDGNADHLRAYLEAHGAQVDVIDRPVDWAVGFRGATALVEVKRPRGRLRASQEAFLDGYRGLCAILRTEADCDALLRMLRRARR